MTLRDRAAAALDATHDHAARKIGIRTDETRDWIASWLDGTRRKAHGIKRSVEYLEMIARSH